MAYSVKVRDTARITAPFAGILARQGIHVEISGPNRKLELPAFIRPSLQPLHTAINVWGYRPATLQDAIIKTELLARRGVIKPESKIDLADVILGRYDQVTGVVDTFAGQAAKGKVNNFLTNAGDVDIVIRYHGGDNCDQTIEYQGKKFTLTLLPAGIFMPNVINIIGDSTIVNVGNLLKEMGAVQAVLGRDTLEGRLMISGKAHVVMPYHRVFRQYQEAVRKEQHLGGCNTGVGPASADKYGRCGMTINDLLKPAELRRWLHEQVPRYNSEIRRLVEEGKSKGLKLPLIQYSEEELAKEFEALGVALRRYRVAGVNSFIADAISSGKRIVCQGTQASFVDIDFGAYPNTTSSHTLTGSMAGYLGIDPLLITSKIGTVKAYSTRSHAGVFPTEIFEDDEDRINAIAFRHLLKKGMEYECVFPDEGFGGVDLAVDKSLRNRIGWMDMVALRYAARINGLTQLAVTKLDVLSGLKTIRLCTQYFYEAKIFDTMPDNPRIWGLLKPHKYEELNGWNEDISKVRNFDELPQNAKIFLRRVAQIANTRIGIISVGPNSDQTFWVPPYVFDSLLK